MSHDSYDLLKSLSPDNVVHLIIRWGRVCWDDIREMIVHGKVSALNVEDDESKLLAFIMAAQQCED